MQHCATHGGERATWPATPAMNHAHAPSAGASCCVSMDSKDMWWLLGPRTGVQRRKRTCVGCTFDNHPEPREASTRRWKCAHPQTPPKEQRAVARKLLARISGDRARRLPAHLAASP